MPTFSLMLLALLQAQPTARELSKFWHPADTIATGFTRLAVVEVCPTNDPHGGHLLAIDSSGRIVELRYVDRAWSVERSFSIGEEITTAAAGATRSDTAWALYVGTVGGRVIEMMRGPLGWSKREIIALSPPIRRVVASKPMGPLPSSIFVVDGKRLVTRMSLGPGDVWRSETLPPIDGGVERICFEYKRNGPVVISTGPKGMIHTQQQDSLGRWTGSVWSAIGVPALDMAMSADPLQRDLAVYYSGQDGIFRYLFYGRKDDSAAVLSVAGGAEHLIGKGDQRRFNEFFGMAGSVFCMFEYDAGIFDWVKHAILPISGRVVSTVFGPGRGLTFHRIYVGTREGTIYEIVREGLEDE